MSLSQEQLRYIQAQVIQAMRVAMMVEASYSIFSHPLLPGKRFTLRYRG